jgi:predicted ribosomally synthesized peptide with nif11-like leader
MAIPLAETLITLGASLQPISSGATTSAGRQKKPWGRAGSAWRWAGWLWEWLLLGFLQCSDKCCRLGDDGKQLTILQMSEEQLKAFLETVKADAGLQEKLKAAADADAVVAIAKVAGFMISPEVLKGSGSQTAGAEISEEELEGVAGGVIVYSIQCICGNTVYL